MANPQVKDSVEQKQNQGYPISRKVIRLKARELKIPVTEFKAILAWCKHMMRCSGPVSYTHLTIRYLYIGHEYSLC